jgi:hypothetical protein
VDVHDDATGQWSTTQLSVAREGIDAVRVGGKVLFVGGAEGLSPGGYGPFDGAVDEYDLERVMHFRSSSPVEPA